MFFNAVMNSAASSGFRTSRSFIFSSQSSSGVSTVVALSSVVVLTSSAMTASSRFSVSTSSSVPISPMDHRASSVSLSFSSNLIPCESKSSSSCKDGPDRDADSPDRDVFHISVSHVSVSILCCSWSSCSFNPSPQGASPVIAMSL